jgi:hypothetical protein
MVYKPGGNVAFWYRCEELPAIKDKLAAVIVPSGAVAALAVATVPPRLSQGLPPIFADCNSKFSGAYRIKPSGPTSVAPLERRNVADGPLLEVMAVSPAASDDGFENVLSAAN